MKVIDTSGLSCPQPVLLVLQYIKKENPASLEVIVDNEASLENVTRAAENHGYAVQVRHENGLNCLVLDKN